MDSMRLNNHFLLHVRDMIYKFGPPRYTWGFVFERFHSKQFIHYWVHSISVIFPLLYTEMIKETFLHTNNKDDTHAAFMKLMDATFMCLLKELDDHNEKGMLNK
jgi:hypothetical protein